MANTTKIAKLSSRELKKQEDPVQEAQVIVQIQDKVESEVPNAASPGRSGAGRVHPSLNKEQMR